MRSAWHGQRVGKTDLVHAAMDEGANVTRGPRTAPHRPAGSARSATEPAERGAHGCPEQPRGPRQMPYRLTATARPRHGHFLAEADVGVLAVPLGSARLTDPPFRWEKNFSASNKLLVPAQYSQILKKCLERPVMTFSQCVKLVSH